MLTEDKVRQALQAVKYPGYSRDIVSFGLVKEVAAGNGAVSVVIQMTSANPDVAARIKEDAEVAVRGLEGVSNVYVQVNQPSGAAPGGAGGGMAQAQRVGGIRHIIAVASGKGGVGKSTVAVNLACALEQLGAQVGLLDCDIYGPSVPLMMGVREKPTLSEAEKLVPPSRHGVKLMSIGLLLGG